MAQFERVSDEEAAQLLDLAHKVRYVLLRAGLSANLADGGDNSPGAVIEVDEGADTAGGIFVTWWLSPEFSAEVSQLLLSGEVTHPSIQESRRVRTAMADAIIGILRASGMTAALSADDMRPLAVVVS